MAAGHRIIITLECQVCKHRNYSTTKNRRNTPAKVALKKYCDFCRSHNEHKETK
jgi:large subunit ribosomal protein L33